MTVTITYSCLRMPKTILDRIYKGNHELWYQECYTIHGTPSDAVAWVLREGPRIKGFILRSITGEPDDFIPRPSIPFRGGEYENADCEAQRLGFKPYRVR